MSDMNAPQGRSTCSIHWSSHFPFINVNQPVSQSVSRCADALLVGRHDCPAKRNNSKSETCKKSSARCWTLLHSATYRIAVWSFTVSQAPIMMVLNIFQCFFFFYFCIALRFPSTLLNGGRVGVPLADNLRKNSYSMLIKP